MLTGINAPATIRRLRHGFLAFASVAIVLLVAAEACAGPPATSDDAQRLPPAEATSVRRTAVAAVQRIIANNPAATATPVPTATAAPTCQGAIWWYEARSHVGESHTVQGPIVGVRNVQSTTLLEVGQPYPDPTGFTVLVRGGVAAQFEGKSVCVDGKIARIEGMPTIQLQDASAVVIVADKT